jgi:hypothetical protein
MQQNIKINKNHHFFSNFRIIKKLKEQGIYIMTGITYIMLPASLVANIARGTTATQK